MGHLSMFASFKIICRKRQETDPWLIKKFRFSKVLKYIKSMFFLKSNAFNSFRTYTGNYHQFENKHIQIFHDKNIKFNKKYYFFYKIFTVCEKVLLRYLVCCTRQHLYLFSWWKRIVDMMSLNCVSAFMIFFLTRDREDIFF